jgi:hypothetical protein
MLLQQALKSGRKQVWLMIIRRLSSAKQPKSLWNLGGLTLSQLGRRVLDDVIANNVVGDATELAFFFLLSSAWAVEVP